VEECLNAFKHLVFKHSRITGCIIHLSFEEEENKSEESDGSDLSSDSNEELERKEADEGYEVI
jgi:hypothetical protein